MTDILEKLDTKGVSVRVAEQVRDVLRNAILEGSLSPGDKLPTEDRLADRFHVSKTAVREALGQLVAEGLIEKRRGAMGGSFVAEGDAARILQVVTDCYRLGGLTLEEVVEFRRLMEPQAAELACCHRTERDLQRMEANLSDCRRALSRNKVDRQRQVDFHCLIAEASHNRLIAAATSAAIRISREFTSRLAFSYQDGKLDCDYNERFLDCIRKRRADDIRPIMTSHFEQSRTLINRYRRMEEPK